jgi:hypothetical protein
VQEKQVGVPEQVDLLLPQIKRIACERPSLGLTVKFLTKFGWRIVRLQTGFVPSATAVNVIRELAYGHRFALLGKTIDGHHRIILQRELLPQF